MQTARRCYGSLAGTPTSFTTTFYDAGALDTHTAAVDWRDGTPVTNVGPVVGSGFSSTHTYATPGVYNVVIGVTDDDGDTGFTGFTVTVTAPNIAPTAVITAPAAVSEGSSVALSGAGSTDSDGTIVSYAWSASAGTLTGAATATPTFTGVDDATVTLTLTVTDNGGAASTTTRTITVTNVAPTVNAGADRSVGAGVALTLLATFTDPGTLDTSTGTVDWGDGSGVGSLGAVTTPFPASHTYAVAGTYTATVCVTDDDGGVGCDTVAVTVTAVGTNVPPLALITVPPTASEGAPVNLSAAGSSDPDGRIVAYRWTTSAGTLTKATAANARLVSDDNRVITVTLTVTDNGGATTTTTTTIAVTNVAPTVNAGAGVTLIVGAALSRTVRFTDPGTADTHRATVTWGDGTPVVNLSSVTSPFPTTHRYLAAGRYTARLCVIDDDGGVGCDDVVVTARLPRLDIEAAAAVDEGSDASLRLTLEAPVPSAVTIRYSTVDGTALAAPHRYVPAGDYEAVVAGTATIPAGATSAVVTVHVNDDLLREGNETFTVQVSGATGAELGRTIRNGGDVCTIVGTSGPDQLEGTEGPDHICGLGGDDALDGRGGDDVLDGGDGVDRVTYLSAPNGVVIDLARGSGTGWGNDTYVSIEEAIGSNHDDQILGSGGANWLYGAGGNDEIWGLAGSDTILGGAGDDTVYAGDGDDHVEGGDGNDFIYGLAGNDRLDGGGGLDTIDGGSGADRIYGDPGNDMLRGGDGDDTIYGGDGDDTILGGAGGDKLFGGNGNDAIQGQAGNDGILGDDGDDILSGGAGNDLIRGGDGDDRLGGGGDDDRLFGEAGDDRLDGGTGMNILDGGPGTNICSAGPVGEVQHNCLPVP